MKIRSQVIRRLQKEREELKVKTLTKCDWCGGTKGLTRVLFPHLFGKWEVLYLCEDCAERFLRAKEEDDEKIITAIEAGILEDYQ